MVCQRNDKFTSSSHQYLVQVIYDSDPNFVQMKYKMKSRMWNLHCVLLHTEECQCLIPV